MNAGELAESFSTIGGYTAFVEDVMIGREDRPEDLAELLDAPAASTARVEEGGPLEELPLLSPAQALRQVASVCHVPVEVIDEVLADAAEPLGQWRDRLRAARDAAVGSAGGGRVAAPRGR